MSKINYDSVQEYLTALVPPREAEMQAMEEYAEKHNFPIIGAASGYYCYQIALMIGARSVFEMGSGYGYSTTWFAKAFEGACAEQRSWSWMSSVRSAKASCKRKPVWSRNMARDAPRWREI